MLGKQAIKGRLAAVLLLTDGLPNVSPPRGELATLKRYRDQHPDLACTISTFGFGYDIDLLRGLAVKGGASTRSFPTALSSVRPSSTLSNQLATMAANVMWGGSMQPQSGPPPTWNGPSPRPYSTPSAPLPRQQPQPMFSKLHKLAEMQQQFARREMGPVASSSHVAPPSSGPLHGYYQPPQPGHYQPPAWPQQSHHHRPTPPPPPHHRPHAAPPPPPTPVQPPNLSAFAAAAHQLQHQHQPPPPTQSTSHYVHVAATPLQGERALHRIAELNHRHHQPLLQGRAATQPVSPTASMLHQLRQQLEQKREQRQQIKQLERQKQQQQLEQQQLEQQQQQAHQAAKKGPSPQRQPSPTTHTSYGAGHEQQKQQQLPHLPPLPPHSPPPLLPSCSLTRSSLTQSPSPAAPSGQAPAPTVPPQRPPHQLSVFRCTLCDIFCEHIKTFVGHLEGNRHKRKRLHATEEEREDDTRALEAARAQLKDYELSCAYTKAKAKANAKARRKAREASQPATNPAHQQQQRLLGKRVKTEPTDSDNDAQHKHYIKHEGFKNEERDGDEEETEDESDQGVDDSSSNEEKAERKTKRRRTECSASGDGAKGGGRGAVPDGLVLRVVKLEKASESDAEEPRMDRRYYAEALGDKGEDKRATHDQGTETKGGLNKEASVETAYGHQPATTTTTTTTGSHDQPRLNTVMWRATQEETLFDRALPVDAFLELMGLQ